MNILILILILIMSVAVKPIADKCMSSTIERYPRGGASRHVGTTCIIASFERRAYQVVATCKHRYFIKFWR